MKVVLDTNVLLSSLGSRSPLRWLFEAFLRQRFMMLVTTDILLEYEEILAQKISEKAARYFLNLITQSSNVQEVVPFFKWNFLKDESDNKFVDCAIAGSADCIVSNDRDFDVLKTIAFPKLVVVSAKEFEPLLTR
jgi:putative PIN family toxin of toxin-antitoxin system